MLTKLIKTFDFGEENRSRLTIGAGTRLNPDTHRLQLKLTTGYSTAAGLEVRTWIANPHAVKGWVGFQAVDIQKKNSLGAVVTSCAYRLGDGTSQYFWNGTTWVGNASSWNTEEDVANNIATFPITSRSLQVIINLKTSDERYTPEVEVIKVLYDANIDFQLDLMARTMIPALKAGIHPIADYVFSTKNTINNFVLPNPIAATPYNFLSVQSVYNHTDDLHHLKNILVSFNLTTRLVTFSSPVPAGKVLFIGFTYEPEVTITTNRTYTEVNKVPAILISDINFTNTREAPSNDEVINRAIGSGWRVLAPMMNDIEFTLNFSTDKESDQYRLADAAKAFFRSNPIIISKGMDEPYRLWLWDEYVGEGIVGQYDIHGGKLRARIVQAAFFNRPPVQVHTVTRVIVTGGNMNTVITSENI